MNLALLCYKNISLSGIHVQRIWRQNVYYFDILLLNRYTLRENSSIVYIIGESDTLDNRGIYYKWYASFI